MQAWMMLAGLIVALAGQWLNAHPRVPSPAVKIALTACGLVLYLVIEQPHGWSGPPLLEWLDKAWLWALAVPGAASLIGTAPNLKTFDPK